MEIAGMAHVQLTVNDLERAKEFCEKVLGYLGMRPAMRFPGGLYMVGGKTAVMITQSSPENREVRFDQRRIGLHHLCFRIANLGLNEQVELPIAYAVGGLATAISTPIIGWLSDHIRLKYLLQIGSIGSFVLLGGIMLLASSPTARMPRLSSRR